MEFAQPLIHCKTQSAKVFATCSHLGLVECQFLGKTLKESWDMTEVDYHIFFQQFLKWVKTCSKCWQTCWLCRKANGHSNLGQRRKDAEQWSAGKEVTVWLASVTFVSWQLQRSKQDLENEDDGEDESDTSDLRYKVCNPWFQRKQQLLCPAHVKVADTRWSPVWSTLWHRKAQLSRTESFNILFVMKQNR